jgi:hypothetical protein
VQTQWNTLSRLKGLELLDKPVDALRTGPLRNALAPGLARLIDQTRRSTIREVGAWHNGDEEIIVDFWLGTICRVLLRIQSYRHGGAVLVCSEALRSSPAGLNRKYSVDYRRVELSLVSRCAKWAVHSEYDERLSDLIDEDTADLPVGAYLDTAVSADEESDAIDSLNGALWFVSLLSRVDGLVLVAPNLRVTGFGVEITVDQPPALVLQALDANAENTRPLDYNHFGTRHRSMMRYCFRRRGAVGFVVSQDGDVRAMTRAGDALLFWENIQLHRR